MSDPRWWLNLYCGTVIAICVTGMLVIFFYLLGQILTELQGIHIELKNAAKERNK